MALKAKKPEVVKESKPKFMISGKSGVGKTMFALEFPSVYFIDVEGGAVRKQYAERMAKNGGVYFGKDEGSQDFQSVINEIRQLATVKHEYRTLVIDSFSKLYNIAAAIAEEKSGSDFGKDKKEANKPTRQLIRYLDELDMTVILICHGKDKWVRQGKEVVNEGTTFDGYDKMEFELDLWIEILKTGKNRNFVVKKTRVSTFEEGTLHALDYKTFADMYGKDVIEQQSVPIKLATPEQVSQLTNLLTIVKVEDDTVAKWLAKAAVQDFSEFNEDQINGCIAFLQKKIKGETNAKN
jgi:RecA/RadA recombinase